MSSPEHLLFIISAPSGTGKTTLIRRVMARDPALSFSISHTTRKPREGEVEGRDYYYVSRQTFQQMIEKDAFIEWAKVYGEYYGTSKEEVARLFQADKDVILDIDVQGAMQVMEKVDPRIWVSLFILPPNLQAIRERLLSRGKDSLEQIARRIQAAKKELSFAKRYTYRVINDDLDQATAQILSIVALERRRRHRPG